MTAVIAVAIVAAAAFWIVQPLLRERNGGNEETNEVLDRLIESKQAIYRSILDLELDLKLRKVSDSDYAQMRRQHEGEAVALLREMDAAAGETELFDSFEAEVSAARRKLRQETEDSS